MKDTYTKQVTGWARPSELEDAPLLWGEKGVTNMASAQGSLGDCWMLASAVALAEYPETIKSLFKNKKYSESGIFKVGFWYMGE